MDNDIVIDWFWLMFYLYFVPIKHQFLLPTLDNFLDALASLAFKLSLSEWVSEWVTDSFPILSLYSLYISTVQTVSAVYTLYSLHSLYSLYSLHSLYSLYTVYSQYK